MRPSGFNSLEETADAVEPAVARFWNLNDCCLERSSCGVTTFIPSLASGAPRVSRGTPTDTFSRGHGTAEGVFCSSFGPLVSSTRILNVFVDEELWLKCSWRSSYEDLFSNGTHGLADGPSESPTSAVFGNWFNLLDSRPMLPVILADCEADSISDKTSVIRGKLHRLFKRIDFSADCGDSSTNLDSGNGILWPWPWSACFAVRASVSFRFFTGERLNDLTACLNLFRKQNTPGTTVWPSDALRPSMNQLGAWRPLHGSAHDLSNSSTVNLENEGSVRTSVTDGPALWRLVDEVDAFFPRWNAVLLEGNIGISSGSVRVDSRLIYEEHRSVLRHWLPVLDWEKSFSSSPWCVTQPPLAIADSLTDEDWLLERLDVLHRSESSSTPSSIEKVTAPRPTDAPEDFLRLDDIPDFLPVSTMSCRQQGLLKDSSSSPCSTPLLSCPPSFILPYWHRFVSARASLEAWVIAWSAMELGQRPPLSVNG